MFCEHERAVLTADLPGAGFSPGDVTAVAHFYALDGRALDIITVEARQVPAVRRSDVLHVRELSAGR